MSMRVLVNEPTVRVSVGVRLSEKQPEPPDAEPDEGDSDGNLGCALPRPSLLEVNFEKDHDGGDEKDGDRVANPPTQSEGRAPGGPWVHADKVRYCREVIRIKRMEQSEVQTSE